MQNLSSDEDALILAAEIRANYTITEIAETLDITEGQVRSLMQG